jgi:hypothetical protein
MNQNVYCLAAVDHRQAVAAVSPSDRETAVPDTTARSTSCPQARANPDLQMTSETAGRDEIVVPAEAGTVVAYCIADQPKPPLVPAPSRREWMEQTPMHFAMRCLPMLIANQSGWWLLNEHPLRVVWDGSDEPDGLRLEWLGDQRGMAVSNFGFGILSWNTPYLFRTPPGINLHVRGPANRPKDGMFALEGVVETDWTMATFTINWKVTRPNEPLVFERGEPICQLVPVRRGELESYTPRLQSLDDAPDLKVGYEAWRDSRWAYMHEDVADWADDGWQKHYFHGREVDGHVAPRGTHQMKLLLRTFT